MSKTIQKTIRLLIIDDHTLFREGLSRLLQSEPGLKCLATVGQVPRASES